MKRISRILLAWGVAVILAGCGQASPVANLPQNITAGTGGSQSDVGNKENEVKQESEGTEPEKQNKEEGAFRFLYEGATLIPGEVFEQSVPGECLGVSEVPSCAFDGNDRVYNYGMFELTAYIDGEDERVYSIYFIDPNLTTTEGLSMGSTVDDMKSLYGEDYEMSGTSYEYTRENTMLSIITQDDIVVGIEYRLDE